MTKIPPIHRDIRLNLRLGLPHVCVSKFFRDQQTVYFIASHANSIFIVAVDDENDGVAAVEVVSPRHANAVLSSYIPTVRWISNQHEQTHRSCQRHDVDEEIETKLTCSTRASCAGLFQR